VAERHQWSQEDLVALQQAAATLERLGVWSVFVRGVCHLRTEMHVHPRDLIRISRLPGVSVEKPRLLGPGHWRVTISVGCITMYAQVDTDTLPAIGWRLDGGEPRLSRIEAGSP